MPRALIVALALLVSACWQADEPVITEGHRIAGFEDGTFRRLDGTEIAIRWTGRAYQAGDGIARVETLPNGKWLVDWAGPVRLIMVAEPTPDGLSIRTPPPPTSLALAGDHGVTLKPAPVLVISGPAQAVRSFATAIAGLDPAELGEGERLVRVR